MTAKRSFRVKVANKTTGAEAVIKIEASSPAMAEAIAAARGFLVGGVDEVDTQPEATVDAAPSGTLATKDIQDLIAVLNSMNDRLDRMTNRMPDAKMIRWSVAWGVVLSSVLWFLIAALVWVAIMIVTLVSTSQVR